MANICWNIMEIRGEDLEKIVEIITSEGMVFKSECFINAPREMREKLLSADELEEQYGATSIYAWNVINIGTQPFEATNDDMYINKNTIYIELETGWSPPIPFIKKLSEMFAVEVELKYLEITSSFSGRVVCKYGEIQEEISDDTIFTENVFSVWEDILDGYEDDEEFLLDLSPEEKITISKYKHTCGEILDILVNDTDGVGFCWHKELRENILSNPNAFKTTIEKIQEIDENARIRREEFRKLCDEIDNKGEEQ